MSIRTQFCPPPPTWRLCHPVNIYVYQNGLEHTKPTLVHIPMEKKKNMTTVLEQIGSRMKLSVGYPVALYHMDGTRVCKTYELEMYNNYVVVTNLEKRFKCVDYGKERMPLVVIGRCSKHVNTLRLQNKRFDLFCRAKMNAKPLHELMAIGESDGLGPDQIAVQGTSCGPLCVKPGQARSMQCCSDEIMCVEGESGEMMSDSMMRGTGAPPSTQFTDEECRLFEELQKQVQCRQGGQGQRGGAGFDNGQCSKEGMGPLGVNKNLVDLMTRYKDVGSDIFKLFQDKIHRDKEAEKMGGGGPKDAISARWQIHGESNLSLQTEQRVKDDLMKLAQQTCQFTFDQKGNFLFSDGCKVGEGGASDFKFEMGTQNQNFGADGNQLKNEEGVEAAGNVNSGMVSKGEGTPGFASGKWNSQMDSQGASFEGQTISGYTQDTGSMQTYTEMMNECDEMDEECIKEVEMQMQREMGGPAQSLSQSGMNGGSGTQDSSGMRVSNMQQEISQIVGNVRRNSRSNSYKGGRLGQQNSQTLETLVEEEEYQGAAEGWDRGQVNASGSGNMQVGNTNSRGQINGGRGTRGYEEEDEEDDFVGIKGTPSGRINNENRFMDGGQVDEQMRGDLNGGFVSGSSSNLNGGGWSNGGDGGTEIMRNPSGGYVSGSKSNLNGGGWSNGGDETMRTPNGGYVSGSKSNISGGGNNFSGGGNNGDQNYVEGNGMPMGPNNGGGGGWNNGGNEEDETMRRDPSGGYVNGSQSNTNAGGWSNWGDEDEGEEMVRRDNSGGFVTGSKSKNSNKSNTSVGRNNRDNEGENNGRNGDRSGGAARNNRNDGGRNNTQGRNYDEDEYEDENEYGGGRGPNVFQVLTQFRNPFREGKVPPLAGKLHKDRLDKLFSENPFRKHFFHGDDIQKRKEGGNENDLIFLRKNTPVPVDVNSTISLPPPPETASPPVFSGRGYRTEYWLQQKPDVFLQQINALVHRHDNTKGTSPPPPLPPGMSDSQGTFTIGPGSPRSSRAKLKRGKKMVNAACGPNTSEIRRGVSAQLMAEIDKAVNDDKWEKRSSRKPKVKLTEGGTQTPRPLVPLEVLPSEDEKPAGIYEGYQESIKLNHTSIDGDVIYSDNDGDDERKVHYRKRKENRRLMRKRKEYYLHPVEEEEITNDDFNEDSRFAYFSANQQRAQQQQPQIRYICQANPYLSPSQSQQQQPVFVQTSGATPTTLPLITRQTTQAAPLTRFTGLVNSSQQPLRFPIQIVQPQHQQQVPTGNGNSQASTRLIVPMTNNMIPSSSNLIRQPIIFTTTQAPQQSSSRPKFLPAIASSSSSPQNTSMRLIRIVGPTPHQQMITSQGGGVMQNKLIQMAPYQPVFPAPQMLRPQQQQQPSSQSQLPQQFILK